MVWIDEARFYVLRLSKISSIDNERLLLYCLQFVMDFLSTFRINVIIAYPSTAFIEGIYELWT